jgi:hypothetical protein
MSSRIAATALAAILVASQAAGQSAITEAESHILGAFSSRAEPGLLARDVRLGPALQRQLAGETARDKVYAALIAQTVGGALRVAALSPVEATIHASLVGGNLSEPLVRIEAGEVALLMQYSAKEKQVVFVEQLRAPAARAEPAPPPAAAPSPTPQEPAAQLPAEAPKPAPIVGVPLPAEPPPMVEKRAPAVVKPKAATVAAPPAPPVQKAQPASAPAAAPMKPRGECVIKPVMSDDDLHNCGALR